MCGKFTAMASWCDVVDFSDAFSATSGAGDNDQPVGFKVMSELRVIVWDREQQKRRVIPMRWGYPRRGKWRSPDPIHARSETIDSKPAFAPAFRTGHRGIVLVKTFNEGKQISPKVTEQHTIMLGDEPAAAIALLFDTFSIPDLAQPLRACVMVTVPANALIRTLTTEHAESDRMPAFLAKGDWETWLGQNNATPDEARACLHTVEGVRWTMTKEERAASKSKRAKPTVTAFAKLSANLAVAFSTATRAFSSCASSLTISRRYLSRTIRSSSSSSAIYFPAVSSSRRVCQQVRGRLSQRKLARNSGRLSRFGKIPTDQRSIGAAFISFSNRDSNLARSSLCSRRWA